jgi:large subunit ribosomal protein L24e
VGSHKCMSMVQQQKKPNKLQWTQSWRKFNKKGKDEGAQRKKVRKVARAVRAIVGMSVDDIKARRKLALPKAKTNNAATDAALKEVKDRKKAKGGNANAAPRGGASVPKMQVKHK